MRERSFLSNPPSSKIIPQWSLEDAHDALSLKESLESLPPREVALVTLYLVAITTGNRASELAAIDRSSISPRTTRA